MKIQQRKIISFVLGAISRYKGIDLIVEKYLEGLESNEEIPDLLIVGRCVDQDYVDELSVLISKNRKISFINAFIDDIQLEKYVKEAKAVLLDYRSISNSGSIVYALSNRVPIVVNDNELVNTEFLGNFKLLQNCIFTYSSDRQFLDILNKDFDSSNSLCYQNYLGSTNIESIVNLYIDLFRKL